MKNWELAALALQWRETAEAYREQRNIIEVPDPPVSASRLEHLANQIDTFLPDRQDIGLDRWVRVMNGEVKPPRKPKSLVNASRTTG